MAIKIEEELLSSQILTLSGTCDQQVKTVSLQFSNNNTSFIEIFQAEIQNLQVSMEGMQSTLVKLSSNATSCKEAVVKLDLQLNAEIANIMREVGGATRED